MIVVGDVHGCVKTLKALVDKLPKDEEIVLVGDLCDRGCFSADVFEFVINSGFKAVLGNHDYLMMKFAKKYFTDKLGEDEAYWVENPGYGGLKTVESYEGRVELLDRHIKWLESLPCFLEFDGEVDSMGRSLFVTHGFGVPYYQRRYQSYSDEKIATAFMWNRYGNPYGYEWEDFSLNSSIFNIFGHDTFEEILVGSNYMGIDTGCGYGKKLSAVSFPAMQIYEQKCFEEDFLSIDHQKLIGVKK